MLHQQLLQQRIREAFVYLRLGGTLGAQEVARVEPRGLQPLLLQHCRHQARGPDFTVADHFRIHRVGDAAVEQRRQAFEVLNKGANQAIRHLGRQQAGDQLALVTA